MGLEAADLWQTIITSPSVAEGRTEPDARISLCGVCLRLAGP
jgi:hypothetical protein